MGAIVISARNAAGTIQRAVASALAQGPYPIVLVDDHSDDDTVVLALAAASRRIEVVRPAERGTPALARQAGLDAVRTEIHAGLNATDEMLPRRMDRLVAAMRDGAAIAVDEVEIVNRYGVRQAAPIPFCVTDTPWPVRLFERNYLPAPGSVAFRTAVARELRYDTSLAGAEDVDILLRAVARRLPFAWIPECGYRIHAGERDEAVDPATERRIIGRCLSKFTYESVGSLLGAAGCSQQVTAWALASMALFRGDYLQALGFVANVAGSTTDLFKVLEPDGPCQLPEAWRIEFFAGTLLALMGQDGEAAPLLEQAEQLRATPEGANNLGVVVARLGDGERARRLFDLALQRYPGYLDARLNRTAAAPGRLTTHTMRRRQKRDTYSAVA